MNNNKKNIQNSSEKVNKSIIYSGNNVESRVINENVNPTSGKSECERHSSYICKSTEDNSSDKSKNN